MELGICMRDLPVNQVVELAKFDENHGYYSIYLPDGGHTTQELRVNVFEVGESVT